MISQNAYWYEITPTDLTIALNITGKWLYWDDTDKLHSLLEELDVLVENGSIKAVKIAKKLPEYDPFPDKPCVLCVFTSDDTAEKARVKQLLKEKFDFPVVVWKSDQQTELDWQEGGWLRIQADINQLRRDIERGEIKDVESARGIIRELSKRLEQVIYNIDDPNQQLEIQLNSLSQVLKRTKSETRSVAADFAKDDILERIGDLEKVLLQFVSLLPSPGSISTQFSSTRIEQQSLESKIRLLFLTANTLDTTRLRLDTEIREIEQALRLAQFSEKFDIRHQWAVRVADLQGCMLRHRPHIVHFSGHGNSISEIILENNYGQSQSVPTTALSKLFSVLKDEIKCVILNACYSEAQARAIAEYVDCVIGMANPISDTAAISFTKSFYQALGFGRSIKTAFELGCIQLELENLGEHEVPRLLALRSNPEQVLFFQS